MRLPRARGRSVPRRTAASSFGRSLRSRQQRVPAPSRARWYSAGLRSPTTSPFRLRPEMLRLPRPEAFACRYATMRPRRCPSQSTHPSHGGQRRIPPLPPRCRPPLSSPHRRDRALRSRLRWRRPFRRRGPARRPRRLQSASRHGALRAMAPQGYRSTRAGRPTHRPPEPRRHTAARWAQPAPTRPPSCRSRSEDSKSDRPRPLAGPSPSRRAPPRG